MALYSDQFRRLREHTQDLCKRIGVNYNDVQTLENVNDPNTFDRIVVVTFHSGERKAYRIE